MPRARRNILKALLFGLFTAIAITLAAMLLMAVALVYLRFNDTLLTILNQLVKIAAVIAGTCAAVPRGSEKGLVTGTVLALVYCILGYGLYLSLGGGCFSVAGMLGEMLLCCAAGAVTGAIRANMNPRSRTGIKNKC